MAGRVQLVTRGLQDVYFTENPEYTYFLRNFKKFTPYSKYHIEHDFEGTRDFGSTLTCTIPQNSGDLIKTMSLKITLDAINETDGAFEYGYIESIGHAMIEYVDLYIGDLLVQHLPSDILQIHSEQYVTQTKQTNLKKLIGKSDSELSGTPVNSFAFMNGNVHGKSQPFECFVDIPFYFHNNPELSIPLCALTKQEVQVVIKLRPENKCICKIDSSSVVFNQTTSKNELIKSLVLDTEMILLDSVEKTKFETMDHEYIITQVQSETSQIPANETSHRMKLQFVNPVKELYFVIQRVGEDVHPFDYDNSYQLAGTFYNNYEHLKNMSIRFDERDILNETTGNLVHLRAVQSGIHHSRTQLFRRFYSYSFALEPERWYPTGQVNLSFVKEQHLSLNLFDEPSERQLRVYALSHNILRIQDGYAKCLFSSG